MKRKIEPILLFFLNVLAVLMNAFAAYHAVADSIGLAVMHLLLAAGHGILAAVFIGSAFRSK